MSSTCIEVEDRSFGIIRVRAPPEAAGQYPLACIDGTHPGARRHVSSFFTSLQTGRQAVPFNKKPYVQLSQLCVLEFSPQPLGNALSITFQPIASDIAAYILNIAAEEGKSSGIEARVDGLGEVDDFNLASPVEDIIGREVSVYVVVSQPEFDIAHQPFEDWAHFDPR